MTTRRDPAPALRRRRTQTHCAISSSHCLAIGASSRFCDQRRMVYSRGLSSCALLRTSQQRLALVLGTAPLSQAAVEEPFSKTAWKRFAALHAGNAALLMSDNRRKTTMTRRHADALAARASCHRYSTDYAGSDARPSSLRRQQSRLHVNDRHDYFTAAGALPSRALRLRSDRFFSRSVPMNGRENRARRNCLTR